MSRAMNIEATREAVIAMCAKHKAAISAIEDLSPTGTRVVLLNGDDAATVAKAFKGKTIEGAVIRAPRRLKSMR